MVRSSEANGLSLLEKLWREEDKGAGAVGTRGRQEGQVVRVEAADDAVGTQRSQSTSTRDRIDAQARTVRGIQLVGRVGRSRTSLNHRWDTLYTEAILV
jgi:hypothetical protein